MGGRGPRTRIPVRDRKGNNETFAMWDQNRAEQEYSNYDYDVTSWDFEKETNYVQTAHSFTINELLRNADGDLDKIKQSDPQEYNNIVAMDKYMRPLSEGVTLHRFITSDALEKITGQKLFTGSEENILKNLQNIVGGELKDQGYASSSYDPKSNVFTSREVMIRVEARKGTKAIVTSNHGESEVVLHRGAGMEIVGVSRESVDLGWQGKRKKWVITVRV